MASLTNPSPSTNLSQLSGATTAVSSISGIVLAIPNFLGGLRNGPQYTIGYQPGLPPSASGQTNTQTLQLPPAFQFHYEGEQKVRLQSDITDHFIEDNTAIQDQIALKPEIITTHGFIGELNNVPPPALQALKDALNVLSPISGYVPAISTTAIIAYNTAFQLYQVGANAVNSAIGAISSLGGQGGEAVIGNGQISNTGLITQSKQQQAFQQFYGYWQNRVLFTVQTPWAVFVNCAIETLEAIQDSETNMITDFVVSFKAIRTAQTSSTPLVLARLQAQAAVTAFGGNNITQPGPSLFKDSGTINPSLGI